MVETDVCHMGTMGFTSCAVWGVWLSLTVAVTWGVQNTPESLQKWAYHWSGSCLKSPGSWWL